jgi:ferredoxin
MNTTRDRWTCIGCSQVSKVKGLYLGESGTSQLQICTRVYNDSVRSVFKSAETDLEDNSEEEKV